MRKKIKYFIFSWQKKNINLHKHKHNNVWLDNKLFVYTYKSTNTTLNDCTILGHKHTHTHTITQYTKSSGICFSNIYLNRKVKKITKIFLFSFRFVSFFI